MVKGIGVANNEVKENLQLAKESHKPIISNVWERTVYLGYKDNIWGDWFSWYAIIKQI